MRLSVVLLLIALAGVVYGASLIGVWAVGVAVIADSIAIGAFALLRNTDKAQRPLAGVTEEQRFIARQVEKQRSA